jgi:hypothetical protein
MITACPCCKGEGWLAIHNDRGAILRGDICTHCMGQGTVMTEVEQPIIPKRDRRKAS